MATTRLRSRIRRLPVVGSTLSAATDLTRRRVYPGSGRYWERRYANGGSSGAGSEGDLARFKAAIVNDLVASNGIGSVIEFGCGDGRQLALARYPAYIGLDVSPTAIRLAGETFRRDPSKSFMLYDPACFSDRAGFLTADLGLSLDVIHHLVEDDVYHTYLVHLFAAARRFVVLYTVDLDTVDRSERLAPHVRHRPVFRDVTTHFPHWRATRRIANPYADQRSGSSTSWADFIVFEPAPTLTLAPAGSA